MNANELHTTLLCMERFGGTFCSNLAAAMRYADAHNRERIMKAFPEIIEKYGPTGPFQRTTVTPVA